MVPDSRLLPIVGRPQGQIYFPSIRGNVSRDDQIGYVMNKK